MITDIFFTLVIGIVTVLSYIFSLIPFAIPSTITDGIVYLTQQLNYLQGVFPIDTFLQCLVLLISFFEIYYSIKIILFVYHHIPFIGNGKSGKMPIVSQRIGHN